MARGTILTVIAAFLALSACTPLAWAIKIAKLGDSISMHMHDALVAAMPDDVVIHAGLYDLNYPYNNQGTKQWLRVDDGFTDHRFVRRLNEVRDRDLILANVGIHNMRVEDAYGTTPDLYEQHLNQIFDVFAQEDVPIVWVTTTPIPFDHPLILESRQEEYRQRELRVVNARADVVVDAYTLLVDEFEERPWRIAHENLHLNDDGNQLVAQAIADVVVGLKGAQLSVIPEASSFLGCLGIAWGYALKRRRRV
ncbi:MAG: SGNH/GDSL hydrolase family protein [Planctomycetota bacterium]